MGSASLAISRNISSAQMTLTERTEARLVAVTNDARVSVEWRWGAYSFADLRDEFDLFCVRRGSSQSFALYMRFRSQHVQRFRKDFVYMISPECTFGTTIAQEVRSASEYDVSERRVPVTLLDLIEMVKAGHTHEQIPMLETTAGRIADYIGGSLSNVLLNSIAPSARGFSLYLVRKRYKKNTVRTYQYFYRRLRKLAMALGWVLEPSEAEIGWKAALAGLRLPRGCGGIAKYSIEMRMSPAEVTEDVLVQWKNAMIDSGLKQAYLVGLIRLLRGFIAKSDIAFKFPNLLPSQGHRSWAISIDLFPEPIRSEVRRLLRWKQDPFAPGRPRRGKHRAVSANILEVCISRLYGYAITYLHMTDVTCLLQLVCGPVIASYLSWAINENKVTGSALSGFNLLLAAVRHYPAYKDVNFDWFVELLTQIPVDSQSVINERKQKKYLPHIVLSNIPERLSELRGAAQKGTRAYALLTQSELMVRWLLVLPWRQRNLREMRLGDREADNLFFDALPSNVHIAKPQWVVDKLAENPLAKFWQIHFRPHETKTGLEIRGVLPLQMVSLLEEYIHDCRPLLVKAKAGKLLFVNRAGNPLIAVQVSALIGHLTSRFCGKRVTPHLFRDAFAHRWLDEHSDDYLSLSKILWHGNVQTTIKIYGRNFDESHGMKKAEEWLAEHEKSGPVSWHPIAGVSEGALQPA
jgi:integrase